MRALKVLFGCESSGKGREAFCKLGHDAWSCDLQPADDGSKYHYQGDVLDIIDDGWDIGIFHPTCTFLSVSGMHWTKRGLRDPQLTEGALVFVQKLMGAPIPKIGIENPIGVISTRIRKPDQIIQPWQFGDDASKATCLWLKGLPLLKPTKLIAPRMVCCGKVVIGELCPCCNGEKQALPRWANQTDSGQNKLPPSADRWKLRSETYQGIADAFADQWGREEVRQSRRQYTQADLFGATA